MGSGELFEVEELYEEWGQRCREVEIAIVDRARGRDRLAILDGDVNPGVLVELIDVRAIGSIDVGVLEVQLRPENLVPQTKRLLRGFRGSIAANDLHGGLSYLGCCARTEHSAPCFLTH